MKGNYTKTHLDSVIATRLDFSRENVSCITFEFIEEIRRLLIKEGIVILPRLGKFKTVIWKKQYKPHVLNTQVGCRSSDIRIYFSKSRTLKDELRRKHGKARRRRVGGSRNS